MPLKEADIGCNFWFKKHTYKTLPPTSRKHQNNAGETVLVTCSLNVV